MADKLTGNERDNTLTGGAGNDTLAGGGGDDVYLVGPGFGTDTITEEGGASSGGGSDKIDATGIAANTTVRKLSDGTYTLTVDGGSIAFDNVEKLAAGAGVNTLDYSSAAAGVFVNLTTRFADDFTEVDGLSERDRFGFR